LRVCKWGVGAEALGRFVCDFFAGGFADEAGDGAAGGGEEAGDGGGRTPALGGVVVRVLGDAFECLCGDVCGLGEAGASAVLCGASCEAEVCLGCGSGEGVKELSEAHVELVGEEGKGLGGGEDGGDDIGFVGGEWGEIAAGVGHWGRVEVRRWEARGSGGMCVK
jgi:hypothetical protein